MQSLHVQLSAGAHAELFSTPLYLARTTIRRSGELDGEEVEYESKKEADLGVRLSFRIFASGERIA